MSACATDGLQLLDDVQQQIVEGEVIGALRNLLRDLQSLRTAMAPAAWDSFAKDCFAGHSVREYLHQSPLARASYQADTKAVAARWHGVEHRAAIAAEDYQNSYSNLVRNLTFGRQSLALVIWAWERDLQTCRSVRDRLAKMEAELDEVCQHIPTPRILRVDSAHRWEIERLLREPSAGTTHSSEDCERDVSQSHKSEGRPAVEWHFGPSGIQTQHGNVHELMSTCGLFGKFDYIYSTSLIESLSDIDARQLIYALGGLLKPQGRLVLANFTPTLAESGYLEVCMGWHSRYRTEEDLLKVAAQALGCRFGQTTFVDQSGTTVFLEVQN